MFRMRTLMTLVLSLVASPVLSQQIPNAAPGFRPDGVYDFSGLDQIGLMNGNLNFQIPIVSLPVRGDLTFALSLQYSSSSWEAEPQGAVGGGVGGARLYPKPQSRAGLGWRLSIPELFRPVANAYSNPRWVYLDSSGSEHQLFPTLHPDDSQDPGDPSPATNFERHMYSRSGGYHRVVCEDANPNLSEYCEVEEAGGNILRFDNFADPTGANYRLVEIRDRFAGNWIRIAYNGNNTLWTVTDSSSARTTLIHFQIPAQGAADQPRLVSSIDVPCFIPAGQTTCPGSGTLHSSWTLTYGLDAIWPPSVYTQSPQQRNVWLLTQVSLPEGTSYSMPIVAAPDPQNATSYDRGLGGALKRLTLPTRGRLEWDWSTFQFPSIKTTGQPCDPEEDVDPWEVYWNTVFQVVARREIDLLNVLLGTRTYRREVCPEEVPNSETACDLVGTGEKLTVTVESPLHDLSEHYFSVYPADNFVCPEDATDPVYNAGGAVDPTAIWEYGMPYTREFRDPTTPGDGIDRFLSSRVYDCDGSANPTTDDCSLVRSEYQAFEIDNPDSPGGWNDGSVTERNRRLRSERVIFEDDSGSWKLRTSSNFDGVGHFRTQIQSASWGGHARTMTTAFNNGDPSPNRGNYTGLPGGTYVQVPTGAAWLHQNFDYRSVSEASIVQPGGSAAQQTARQDFCFSNTTGFLERTRTRTASDGSIGTNDILVVRTPAADGQGDLAREQGFGGDGQTLSTGLTCTSPISSTSGFWLEHGITQNQDGTTESRTSQWRNTSGTTSGTDKLDFFASDQTFDMNSGLIQSSRDSATLETQFFFDGLGRLIDAKPSSSSGGAFENWQYINASGSNKARVKHAVSGNGASGALFREEQWHYDGFGRLKREERKATDDNYNERYTYYDEAGNRAFLSEWGRGNTASQFGVRWELFDPFGRPGRVKRVWSVLTVSTEREESRTAYVGDRQVTRTQWIATAATGGAYDGSEVSRVELYDGHGRLQAVQEYSAGVSAIQTDYEYDVGGRLRRSRTPRSIGGNQDRWWLYDQRGFLTSERSPEKGTSGTGTDGEVLFSGFDTLGHATSRSDAGLVLSYAFDRAGRLKTVREPASGNRIWKEYTYSDSNFTGNWSKGKLSIALGYNWFTVPPGTNFEARFLDALTYGGTAGRLSNRTTTFQLGFNGQPVSNNESIALSEVFDAAGQLTRVDYPTCTAGTGTCVVPPARSLETTYDNGFLSRVFQPGVDWVSSASYFHSGLWQTMVRGNGVVESQAIDVLRVARPALLEAKDAGGVTLWRSGSMVYDRSGNLMRLETDEEGGSDTFTYDKVGRLASATFRSPATLGSMLFADGFESATEARWGQAWPPAGWAPGQKTETYSFDRFGNLLDDDTGVPPTDPNDWPTREETNRLDLGPDATYDARGNLTYFGGLTNSFDPLNRQYKRLSPDGSADYFLYDASDERVITYSLFPDPYNPPPAQIGIIRWTIRDFNGKVLRTFVSANGHTTAERDYVHTNGRILGTEDLSSPAASRMFATTDQLGTPRLWTNSNGEVVRKHKYHPFGKEATPSDQWAVALQFTGHERDRNDLSTTLDDGDFMHARFSSPLTGRMLSIDPVLAGKQAMKRPQAWNRYAYVLGNPMKYIDPTGTLFNIAGCEAGSVDKCRSGTALLKRTLGDNFGSVAIANNGAVTLNKISAAEFAAKGTFEKGLGLLIANKSTFTLNVGSGAGASTGGAGFVPSAGGGGTIFVEQGMFSAQTGNVSGTSATAFAHETGHGVGTLFPQVVEQLNSSLGMTTLIQEKYATEAYAVTFENRYRSEHRVPGPLRYNYNNGDGFQEIRLDPDSDLMP